MECSAGLVDSVRLDLLRGGIYLLGTQGCFEEKKKAPKETSFISKWHFMKHACYCRNPDNYRWVLPISTLRSKHSITDLNLLAN